MKKHLLAIAILASFMSFGVVNNNTTIKVEADTINIADYSIADSLHASGNASGLLTELRRLTSPGKAGSYNDLWDTYYSCFKKNDNYIMDYYSNISKFTEQNRDRGSGGNVEGEYFNREHSIPQSWWGKGTSNQGADPYIVIPADKKVNGQRGNVPYGVVSSATYSSANGFSKKGSSDSSVFGYTGTVFEPDDSVKGDLARNTLYAIAKYENSCNWTSDGGSAIFSGSSSSNFGLTTYGIKLLTAWNNLDKPDEWEIGVNNRVSKIQKNRNPFIDHPEYVNTLWGNVSGMTPYDEGPMELDNITVDNPKTKYYVGEEFVKPTVTAHYTNGKTRNVTDSATFTGFDSSTTGTRTINVSYEDEATSYQITVSERPAIPLELTLSSQSLSINVQETSQITFSTNKTATVTWSINDQTVATLSAGNGSTIVVTALKEGNAVITVTAETDAESVQKTVSLTVNAQYEPTPLPAKGCGGNVATASIVLSSLALAGIVTIVIVTITRKKKQTSK